MPNPTKTNSEQGDEKELKRLAIWKNLNEDLQQKIFNICHKPSEGDWSVIDQCIDTYLLIQGQQSLLLDKVKEIVSGNYKGAFIDNAGFECWYVDDLLQSLDSLIDKK